MANLEFHGRRSSDPNLGIQDRAEATAIASPGKVTLTEALATSRGAIDLPPHSQSGSAAHPGKAGVIDPIVQLRRAMSDAAADVANLELANRTGDLSRAFGLGSLVWWFIEHAATLVADVGRAAAGEFIAPVRALLLRARAALEAGPHVSQAAREAAQRHDYTLWDAELAPWRARASAANANPAANPGTGRDGMQLVARGSGPGRSDDHAVTAAPSPVVEPPAAATTGAVEKDEHRVAARGTAGNGGPLPHLETIQKAFGRHNVSSVRAYIGGEAATASRTLGARAYAYGNTVAFAEAPDVHTAAHEAAHTVQQQYGVSPGGGQSYERHADRVAARVSRGTSAEDLLDAVPKGGGATAIVQLKGTEPDPEPESPVTEDADEGLTASEYIATNQMWLVMGVRNTVMNMPYETGSPFASFADPRTFAALVAVALTSKATSQQLEELLQPKRLTAVVDRVRLRNTTTAANGVTTSTNRGPSQWQESVAVAVASALNEKVLASLKRVMPRYVDARYQALLAAEAKASASLAVSPEPDRTRITASSAVDRMVIDALVTGTVSFDAQQYRATHSDGKPVFREARAVAYMWEAISFGSYWIRVIEAGPITVEDVALTMFGSTEQSHEIVGAYPLFGFTHAHKLEPSIRNYLEANGEDLKAEADPKQALLDPKNNHKALLEELALAESKEAATGGSKAEIVQRFRLNVQILDSIAVAAAKFGLQGRLAHARKAVDDKSIELAKPETDFAEVSKWDGNAALQAGILQRVAFGLDGIRERLDGMTKGMANLPPRFADINLPEYVKKALHGVATAFVDAAALCTLPGEAEAQTAEAEQLAKLAVLDMLDGMLTEILRVVHAAKHVGGHTAKGGYGEGHPDYVAPDADAVATQETALRGELARVRVLMISSPMAAAAALRTLNDKISALGTEADIVGNIDELDKLWQKLFMVNLMGPQLSAESAAAEAQRDYERKKLIRDKIDGFSVRWRSAYAKWKAGDKIGATQIIDGIKADPNLPIMLSECRAIFQDAADVAQINKLALLFGITLLTMGAGAWVEGVAVGLEWGTGATILATASAEAVTFTALSQTFLDTDHSVGHVTTELAFNVAMFSVLRGFSRYIEALKLGSVVKIGATFTGQTVISTAMMLAKAEAEKYWKEGKHLTEQDIKRICLESVVTAVGMTVATAGFSPFMLELQSAGKTLGTKVKTANVKGKSVQAMTEALKGNKSIDAALELIKAHREWSEAKLDALRELELAVEAEKIHPPKKGQSVLEKAKLSAEQISELRGVIAEAKGTMKAAETMLTLDPEAPGKFTCPQDRIPEVLEDLGGPIGDPIIDPVSQAKTYTVKSPDGKLVTITESIARPNEGSSNGIPPIIQPPVIDTSHLPGTSQAIERWQTGDLAQNSPELWQKTAEGKSFKDVYSQWMQQETRLKKNGDHWEVVYPAGCPKDFKPIFDGMVQRGDIARLTQGELNVNAAKQAGIDLDHLDPLSPEYMAQREKLTLLFGDGAVKRWETTKVGTDSPGKQQTTQRVRSVLAEGQLEVIKAAFPDCEVMLTGSLAHTSAPLTGPKAIRNVDVVLVIPKDMPQDSRAALEMRARGLRLKTTPEYQAAGGPAELAVDARAMSNADYMGVRTGDADNSAPTNDLRIDDHAKTAADVAKQYGVSADPAHQTAFEAVFNANPAEATAWVRSRAGVNGLAGRLLAQFHTAALSHFKPTEAGVDICGHVKVSPELLARMPDADVAKLVELCTNKGPSGEYPYFERTNKPAYRLRFPGRLTETATNTVTELLIALGIGSTDPAAKLFDNLSEADSIRLWELAGDPDFKNANAKVQAAQWALAKSPTNVNQFVADFQFYIADAKLRSQEILRDFYAKVEVEKAKQETASGKPLTEKGLQSLTQQVAKSELGVAASNKAKLEAAAFDKALTEYGVGRSNADGTTGTVGADRANAARQINLDAQTGEFTPSTMPTLSVPDAALPVYLKANADSLNFSDAHDAAYHAHKHAMHLPSPPAPTEELAAYVRAAREVIKNTSGELVPEQRPGVRNVYFRTSDGDLAIVFVDASGNARIATFIPGKKTSGM
jgi:hypothetical protein